MSHTSFREGMRTWNARIPAWEDKGHSPQADRRVSGWVGVVNHFLSPSDPTHWEARAGIATSLLPRASEESRGVWSPSDVPSRVRQSRAAPGRPGSGAGTTFPPVNLPRTPQAPHRSVNLFKQLCQRHGFKFGYKERRERKIKKNVSCPGQDEFLQFLGPCLTTKPLPPVLVLRFSRGAGNQRLGLRCLRDMGVK